jgi:hypothetical protein
MVLGAGAGAGEIGVDITWAASGGEEGGPREVGGVDMVLGAGTGEVGKYLYSESSNLDRKRAHSPQCSLGAMKCCIAANL